MSEEKSRTRHHRHHKHHAVRPYITTPLIYVLISLVIVLPLCFALLNYSESLVHRAQPSFSYSISDIELNDKSYKATGIKNGSVSRPNPNAGDKVGVLSCKAAGLSCSVYFGENRVSMRRGAGMNTKILPGDTGVCELSGERAVAFKSIGNIKTGDKISLDTNWGSFVYSVSEIKTGSEPPESTMPQELLLITSPDDKTFSNFNEERLYVLADIESGPQLEEAQQ